MAERLKDVDNFEAWAAPDVGSHGQSKHSVPCVESMTVDTSAAAVRAVETESTEVSVVKHEQQALERVNDGSVCKERVLCCAVVTRNTFSALCLTPL